MTAPAIPGVSGGIPTALLASFTILTADAEMAAAFAALQPFALLANGAERCATIVGTFRRMTIERGGPVADREAVDAPARCAAADAAAEVHLEHAIRGGVVRGLPSRKRAADGPGAPARWQLSCDRRGRRG